MAKKILRTLSNNIGFKLLAVVLAFILWIVVYNIDDPEKTRTYSVKVTVTNEASLAQKNLCYKILNNSDTVTFSVTATRSVLDNLDNKDFTAVADFSDVVVDSKNMTGTVDIAISSSRNSNQVKIAGQGKQLQLSLENLMTKQFMITPATKGEVASNYTLGDVTVVSQNVLKVSGPESIVSTIASVIATVDVEGMSQEINDNVVPTLLSEDGKEIDSTRLTLSSATVAVKAKILNTKTISLNIVPTGELSSNYYMTGVTSDPEEVVVKGTTAALNAISSITISSDALSLTKATTENIETTVDITDYLPEGVTLLDNEDAIIKVTVQIEEYQTKSIAMSTGDISVNGLEKGYTLSFLVNSVNVRVSGLESDIAELLKNKLTGSINASTLNEGVSIVNVDLGLNEDLYSYEPVTISVRVMKEKSTDDNTPADGGNNNNNNDNNSGGTGDDTVPITNTDDH